MTPQQAIETVRKALMLPETAHATARPIMGDVTPERDTPTMAVVAYIVRIKFNCKAFGPQTVVRTVWINQ